MQSALTSLHPTRSSLARGTGFAACPDEAHASPAPALARWTDARCWFALAIGSLVIAGLLSLTLVVGRIPVINAWIADPLFFKRCLVVHVNLALVVWFHASATAWLSLLAVRTGTRGAAHPGFHAAAIGVILMTAGATIPGAQPVLSNYVPAIDHHVFLAGVGLFFGGTGWYLVKMLSQSAQTAVLPPDTAAGLRASAVAFCVALATFAAAWAGLPAGLDAHTHYEFLFWGGGHVLQVANVAAMLALWLFLIGRVTGRAVLAPQTAGILFGLLVLPHLAAPLLTLEGTLSTLYHSGSTQLMRWGIFPVTLIVLGLSLRHLRRHGAAATARWSDDPRLVGVACSVGLTLLGFIFGACIRNSNTIVPGHYHASIGAVTMIFMAAAYEFARMVAPRGAWQPGHRPVRLQLWLFGGGQAVFAIGFVIAGVYGAARKAYGTEQQVRSAGELAGLGIMSLGGLVAVIGGVLFLTLIVRQMLAWKRPRTATQPSPQGALS